MRKVTILRKVERLNRCLDRVEEVYDDANNVFRSDYTLQDSVILNIQRACEQAIDIAQMLVAELKLPRPTENASLFDVLGKAGLIPDEMASRLRAMVGFRNIAVHEYEVLDLDIVEAVIEKDLVLLRQFGKVAISFTEADKS